MTKSYRRGAARVWDVKTLKPVSPNISSGHGVRNAWLSSCGARVITRDFEGQVHLWDRENGSVVSNLSRLGRIHSIVVSETRPVAFFVLDGNTVTSIDLIHGEVVHRRRYLSEVSLVELDCKHQRIAVALENGHLEILSDDLQQILFHTTENSQLPGAIESISFHPEKDLVLASLSAGADKLFRSAVSMLQLLPGSSIHRSDLELDVNASDISGLTRFIENGDLVVVDGEKSVRIFESMSGNLVAENVEPSEISFDPDTQIWKWNQRSYTQSDELIRAKVNLLTGVITSMHGRPSITSKLQLNRTITLLRNNPLQRTVRPDWHFKMLENNEQTGHTHQMQIHLDILQKLSLDKDTSLVKWIARSHLRSKRYQESIDSYNLIPDQIQNDWRIQMDLGVAYFGLREWIAAIKHFTNSLNLNTEDSRQYFRAIYFQAICHAYLKNWPEAQKSISAIKKNMYFLDQSGRNQFAIALGSKNWQSASELMLSPFDLDGVGATFTDSVLATAIDHAKTRKEREYSEFESDAETPPTNPEFWKQSAIRHAADGDWETAWEHGSAALALGSNDWHSRHILAVLSFRRYSQNQKDDLLDLAIQTAFDAIAMDGQKWESYRLIAWLYFNKNDVSNCIKYLKKATQLEPEIESNWNDLVVICHLKTKDRKTSESYARRLLEINPTSKTGIRALIDVLVENGRHKEAVEACLNFEKIDLNSSLVVFPDKEIFPTPQTEYFGSNHHAVGEHHRKAYFFELVGNKEKQIECLTKIIDQSPADLASRRNRGDLFFQIGRFQEAVEDYRSALESIANDRSDEAQRFRLVLGKALVEAYEIEEAAEVFDLYENVSDSSYEKEALIPYRFRIAYLGRNWDQALSLIDEAPFDGRVLSTIGEKLSLDIRDKKLHAVDDEQRLKVNAIVSKAQLTIAQYEFWQSASGQGKWREFDTTRFEMVRGPLRESIAATPTPRGVSARS